MYSSLFVTAAALNALLYHIQTGEELMRERAIQFFREKVLPLSNQLIHPSEAIERFLLDYIKKILLDVTEDEFKFFVDVLSSLNIVKNGGGQEIINIIADQIDTNAEFAVSTCCCGECDDDASRLRTMHGIEGC